MESRRIVLERNVAMETRDGVTLMADIYRPEKGTYPVLLTRLPYSKEYGLNFMRAEILAEAGYVVIVQDVRGRYSSSGKFVPYVAEESDGFDTIKWAANLPYANGVVGMFGLSYYGYTQMLAAISGAPELKAIAPVMAQNSMTDVFNDHNGALELGMWETWNLESMLPNMIAREESSKRSERLQDVLRDLDDIDSWYDFKPYVEWPPIVRTGAMNYFSELLSLRPDDAHWRGITVRDHYARVNVPGLHIAGWYDCFLDKTIANFKNGHERGLGDKLIIGPWTHANFTQYIGNRDFGSAANKFSGPSMHKLHLAWFDHHLKGRDEAPRPAVEYFAMGANEWRSAKNWPLENTHFTPFYLASEGSANTRNGYGRLHTKLPEGNQTQDFYTYNPENPVPSNGGGTLHKGLQVDGPKDQAALELREDVLCYTSAPVEEPLEVTGPIVVELYAKTDAVNTDFTAKLVDVAPDGTAFNLTDGIIRASSVHQNDVANHILKYTIDLWAVSNVFLPGHQIRVEISSSNFPRFDPNPNTGGSFIDTATSIPANQVIFHDAEHPSCVILPIIKK
ncbi:MULTISPECIES: CocE/NonD family hydrolase [unclassified Listeria]|uniref:CocE/NonD family hydrolase n=1 Tax=unclassified Listeria TaxID=2642072 RepID=UPI000B58D1E5|nr:MULTISPECIES: CocE/NonD family hydrolase [unclassified Listeria]